MPVDGNGFERVATVVRPVVIADTVERWMEYVIIAEPLLLSGATYPTEIFKFPGVKMGASMVDGTVRGVAVACAE